MAASRRILLAVVTTMASLAAAGSTTGPASAVTPGTNGKIVFMRSVQDPATMATVNQIFTANADGTGELNLSNDLSAYDSEPEFSPDGTKIVFVRTTNEGRTIPPGCNPGDVGCFPLLDTDTWVMDADGGNKRNLTLEPDVFDVSPTWSPDGSRIAYVTAGDVWTMRASDGGDKTNLTSNSLMIFQTSPSWSPDGTQIAYGNDDTNGGNVHGRDIWAMNAADGSNKHAITATSNGDSEPAWSPDGSKIAFTRSSGQADVFVANANGTGQTNLSQSLAPEFSAAWSPDGTRIIFVRLNTTFDLVTMDASDGGNQSTITYETKDPDDNAPSWGSAGPALTCMGKPVTKPGTGANNTIVGTSGPDVIAGLGGNDVIDGRGGADTICGGSGTDTVTYTGRNDVITANVSGGTGDDGGNGDGAAGSRDTIFTDVENLTGGNASDLLTGNSSANVLTGGPGKDVLRGAKGNDKLIGGDGDDTLYGYYGADTLMGDAGIDTATYSERAEALTLTANGAATSGSSNDGPAGARDRINSTTENIIGGKGTDTITGNGFANRLTGGPGTDSLFGLGGSDYLHAKDGIKDTKIDGGTGTDTGSFDTIDPPRISVP